MFFNETETALFQRYLPTVVKIKQFLAGRDAGMLSIIRK